MKSIGFITFLYKSAKIINWGANVMSFCRMILDEIYAYTPVIKRSWLQNPQQVEFHTWDNDL